MRNERRYGHEVVRSHSSRQQRLVRVPERRVHEKKPLVLADSLRERLRTALFEDFLETFWWLDGCWNYLSNCYIQNNCIIFVLIFCEFCKSKYVLIY